MQRDDVYLENEKNPQNMRALLRESGPGRGKWDLRTRLSWGPPGEREGASESATKKAPSPSPGFLFTSKRGSDYIV